MVGSSMVSQNKNKMFKNYGIFGVIQIQIDLANIASMDLLQIYTGSFDLGTSKNMDGSFSFPFSFVSRIFTHNRS